LGFFRQRREKMWPTKAHDAATREQVPMDNESNIFWILPPVMPKEAPK